MKNNNYTYLKFSTLILTITNTCMFKSSGLDHDHEEHLEPVGFVLKMNGTEHLNKKMVLLQVHL